MTSSKVIINFSRCKFTDAGIIAKSGVIESHMTGNLHFETPVPSLAVLHSARILFIEAHRKSINGSKVDTSIKNTLRSELENILVQLAQYVQTTSQGVESKILSAGFDVRKKPEPIGPLEQATGLIIRYGNNSGEVTMECNVIKKARIYYFEYTEAPLTPNSRWQSKISSKHKIKLSGLTSEVHYVFRVAGMNTDPACNWSEPVRKLVV